MIYLNSGTHSITPLPVLEAVTRYQREYERNPTASLFTAWGRVWETQKQVARFFGARGDDFFLEHNVTAALNRLILGFDLAPGREILVSNVEYGAISNICRFRAERDGRPLRSFALPAGPECDGHSTAEWAGLVVDALSPETGMLVLSHVISSSGLRLPIREIARETRKRGVVLIVDGAHVPGAMPLDLGTLDDADAYAGSLHKWMLGPKGTSFGWAPARVHAQLRPIQGGWTTFELPMPFSQPGGASPFQRMMMNSACIDFAPIYALADLLAWREAYGEARIHARIDELKAVVRAEMARELGWDCLSPADPLLHGPVTAFRLPPKLEAMGFGMMIRLLREHGLQVITPMLAGRTCLRFSPHIYNTESEIREGVRIVRDFARREATT